MNLKEVVSIHFLSNKGKIQISEYPRIFEINISISLKVAS